MEADSALPTALDAEFAAVERRIYRMMCGVVAAGFGVSLFVATPRVSAGLLLGGVLSIVNYRWLASSVRAVFSLTEASGARPRWSAARFFLRYFFLAAIIAVAYVFNAVLLVAVFFGLCAFAAAGMLEGFIQLYFAIVTGRKV